VDAGFETVAVAAVAVVRQIRLPGRGRTVHAAGEGRHDAGRRHVRVSRVQPVRVGGRAEDRQGGVAAGRPSGTPGRREAGRNRVQAGRSAERGRG